jgi:DNA invertase Pin-like site-specific DNA recombinase
MNENKKRVAIYIRTAQVNGVSIKKQETELKKYAECQGYTELMMYVDGGYNGVNFKRPAFMQMTHDIQNGEIDKVITTNLSRIGRETIQVLQWLVRLQSNGIEIETSDFLPPFEILMMFSKFKEAYAKTMAAKKKTKSERER